MYFHILAPHDSVPWTLCPLRHLFRIVRRTTKFSDNFSQNPKAKIIRLVRGPLLVVSNHYIQDLFIYYNNQHRMNLMNPKRIFAIWSTKPKTPCLNLYFLISLDLPIKSLIISLLIFRLFGLRFECSNSCNPKHNILFFYLL